VNAICGPVLVVEDDVAIRETIQDVLELEGFDVHTAENGRVALNLLIAGDRPKLILLDLMMPVMNGWEFLEAMRERDDDEVGRAPIVVLSGAADLSELERAGYMVMRKPPGIDQLVEVVNAHCGKCS
jgi:CheY-like chemotaxis protein